MLEVAAWVVTVSDGKLRRVEAVLELERGATPPRTSAPPAARASTASARGLQLLRRRAER